MQNDSYFFKKKRINCVHKTPLEIAAKNLSQLHACLSNITLLYFNRKKDNNFFYYRII